MVQWQCVLVTKARLGHIKIMTFAVIRRGGLLLGMLLLWACGLGAAPLKLESLQVGSTTYRQVTVLGFNDCDLYFTHEKGISNVKLRLLPKDLQQRFGYNEEVAAAAEQKQAEAGGLYRDTIASNLIAQAARSAAVAKQTAISSEESLADPVSESSLLGKAAPAFEVEKWLGDKPALDGKFLLVYFWAPWSTPCRKLIPEMNGLQKKFSEKLVVAGLASDSEEDLAQLEQPKLEFASAVDSKARLATAAGLTSIPSVLFLNPKGIVLYFGHPAAIGEMQLQRILAQKAE
jgi:cytochrome c biogenesis protein CcmG, thiol:disulfide interchange protein DsbE